MGVVYDGLFIYKDDLWNITAEQPIRYLIQRSKAVQFILSNKKETVFENNHYSGTHTGANKRNTQKTVQKYFTNCAINSFLMNVIIE